MTLLAILGAAFLLDLLIPFLWVVVTSVFDR
jgi:hypothetical protein